MRDACDDVRLSAFLDDELDEDQALAVARHAATCDRCTTELDDLRSMRTALRSLPAVGQPPLMIFREAVVTAEAAAVRRRRVLRQSAGAGLTAAAMATAVWFAGAGEDGTVVPPMDRFVADHVVRVDHGPMLTPVDLGR